MNTRPISHRSLVLVQHRTLGTVKVIRRSALRSHLARGWRVIRRPAASAPPAEPPPSPEED